MSDLPLEYALIAFEDAKFSGKIVPELVDLAERGIVRYVDIAFIQKEADGTTHTLELNDLDPELYEMFVPMGEHVSSMFTNDDLEIAASRLPEGSAAMLILWENLWVAGLARCHRERRWRAAGAHADRSRSGRGVRAGAGRRVGQRSVTHRPSASHLSRGGTIMRGRRGVNPPGPVGGVGAGNPPGPVGGVGRGPNPPGPVGGVGRGPNPPGPVGGVGRRNGVGLLR